MIKIIMMKRAEIYVEGVVQRVGFRYFAKKVARELGVKGFVKNLPDGRVYIVAEGDENQLEKFLCAVRGGPSLAVVRNIRVIERSATGEFNDFVVAY